jgi:hypothetical protein
MGKLHVARREGMLLVFRGSELMKVCGVAILNSDAGWSTTNEVIIDSGKDRLMA